VTLDDVAKSVRNGIFVSRPGTDPNGVPILRIGAVRPLRLDLSDLRYSGETVEELRAVDRLALPGDLLFTRYNGNPELVGSCAVVPASAPDLTYPDKLIRARIDRRLALPEFLAYAFSWQRTRAQVREHVKTTAGQAGIAGGELKKILLPLPPLEEQRRIVAVLDEQLSRLDAAEQSLGHAGHRIALTVRVLLDQYFGSSGVRERGWRYERLEDVADIRGGQTPRKNSVEFHTEWAPGLFPFWKVGDMNGAEGRLMARSRTYLSAEQIASAKVRTYPAGTILLPKRGGAIATNKKRITSTVGAFDLNVMGVVPNKGVVPEFLWHWFQTIDLNELSDGSNVPQINKPDLSHLLIPVPSEAEQKSVVWHLDDLLARFDRMQGTISDVRPNWLRASLLQQAFAGRLVPQNPADEPAEALLDRIRAEREAAGATKSRRRSPRRAPAQRKRTSDSASAPDAPPPPRADASAFAAATQPTLDLEMPS
jgi:type I restriction enzyme S subunit